MPKTNINLHKSSEKNSVQPLMDTEVVRWYVLVYSENMYGSVDSLKQIKGLREKRGDVTFDYLAPKCKVVQKNCGKFKETEVPLLFNYVFIHASVKTIWEIRKLKPAFCFLPRVIDNNSIHYPFLTDDEMKNLEWVMRSYQNEIPVYRPNINQLVKGDKVRINNGKFAGAVAEVIINPGRGSKDVMVCLDNCFTIPLIGVSEGDYEIIELNKSSRHNYFQLNDTKLLGILFDGVRLKHKNALTDDVISFARTTILRYSSLDGIDTDIMRIRQSCILLPAYSIIGKDTEYLNQLSLLHALGNTTTATKILPLLYLTLYGCTDNINWHQKAHQIIDNLPKDTSKKSDKFLIEQLKAFDKAFGH